MFQPVCDMIRLENGIKREKRQRMPKKKIGFEKWRTTSPRVKLYVSGTVFRVTWSLMMKVPQSTLAQVASCKSEEELLALGVFWNPAKHRLHFSRGSRNFLHVLDLHCRDVGRLHMPASCCPVDFVEELVYWGFSESHLQPCCFKRWIECQEELDWDQESQKEAMEENTSQKEKTFCQSPWLWDLFEKPHSSMGARVLGLISASCIGLSTLLLTLDTLPYFQHHENKIAGEFAPFVIIEICYMSYFTIEFLARLLACPSKVDFGKNLMNWIDLLAILPYFVTLGLNMNGIKERVGQVRQPSGDPLMENKIMCFFQVIWPEQCRPSDC